MFDSLFIHSLSLHKIITYFMLCNFLTMKVCMGWPLKASTSLMTAPLVEMSIILPSLLNFNDVQSQSLSCCNLNVVNGPQIELKHSLMLILKVSTGWFMVRSVFHRFASPMSGNASRSFAWLPELCAQIFVPRKLVEKDQHQQTSTYPQ